MTNPCAQAFCGRRVLSSEIVMRRLALLLPAALILGSCGTPEYRAERSVCAAEWEQKIPPRYAQRIVQRVKYIEVPTGEITCTGKGNTQHCVSKTRLEDVPYTEVETYDVNQSRRDVQIQACAVKACSAKFGNPDCKAG